jgi:hypothetical protein
MALIVELLLHLVILLQIIIGNPKEGKLLVTKVVLLIGEVPVVALEAVAEQVEVEVEVILLVTQEVEEPDTFLVVEQDTPKADLFIQD